MNHTLGSKATHIDIGKEVIYLKKRTLIFGCVRDNVHESSCIVLL